VPEGAKGLDQPFVGRLINRVVAGLVLRPWLDRAALKLLVSWYLPLSRAWAAALAAGGSADQFFREVPRGRRTDVLIPRLLAATENRLAALAAADSRWDDAFFGSGPATAAVEEARAAAAAALVRLKASFTPLHLERPLPAVRWAIEPPDQVARRHGQRLTSPETAFALPTTAAAPASSRGFRSRGGEEGWVRFPSPAAGMGDIAYARVSAPPGRSGEGAAAAVPSLIFCHGIGVESEFGAEPRDPLLDLPQMGIRVIRPEAPWHGRRRLPGCYGGEPILAQGPGGMLDFFHAAVREIGLLTAWVRATRDGPVAIGGVSLGALTAQLAAVVSQGWPAEMRPDALFLVAPSRSIAAVAFDGSLSRALGVPQAMKAAGWTEEIAAAWLPLLEPAGAPAVDPDRIVVVLGEADDVTLAAGGEALAHDWQVPAENVYRCEAGHFSTSLGLRHHGLPLERLVSILLRMA
jgi:hypothetical protein